MREGFNFLANWEKELEMIGVGLTELRLVALVATSWTPIALGHLSTAHGGLHILHLLILLILLLILLSNRCSWDWYSTLVLLRHHPLVLHSVVLIMTELVRARASLKFVTLWLVLLEIVVHLGLNLVCRKPIVDHDPSHVHSQPTTSSDGWHALGHLLLHV